MSLKKSRMQLRMTKKNKMRGHPNRNIRDTLEVLAREWEEFDIKMIL